MLVQVQVLAGSAFWFCRCCCRADAGAGAGASSGSAFWFRCCCRRAGCFVLLMLVLDRRFVWTAPAMLVQALALDRHSDLHRARDDIMSCPE